MSRRNSLTDSSDLSVVPRNRKQRLSSVPSVLTRSKAKESKDQGIFAEFYRLSKVYEIFESEKLSSSNKMADAVVSALQRMQFLQLVQSSVKKFQGETEKSIFAFLEDFESLASAGGLSDEIKLDALPLCLESYPRSVYFNIPGTERQNYASARSALIKHFQPPAVREKAIIEFQSCKQSESESLDKFAHKLMSICKRAYPNITVKSEIETLVKVQFLNGVLSKYHSIFTVSGTPENLEKAIETAKRIESPFKPDLWATQSIPVYGTSESSDMVMNINRSRSSNEDPSVWAAINEIRDLLKNPSRNQNFQARETKKFERPNFEKPFFNKKFPKKFENRDNQKSPEPSSSSFRPKSKSDIVCYRCGGKGHVQRKCPTADAGNDSVKPARTSAPWRRNNDRRPATNAHKPKDGPNSMMVLQERIATLEQQNEALSSRLLDDKPIVSSLNSTPPCKLSAIRLLFGDVWVEALVDTGSELTLMTIEFANSVLKNKVDTSKIVSSCKTANDESMHIYGKVNLNFKIENRKFCEEFALVEKSPFKIILGLDFMVKHRLWPNVFDRFAMLGDEKIPLYPIYPQNDGQNTSTVYVCFTSAVKIPARSEVIVPAKLLNLGNASHSLFVPDENWCSENDVFIASALVAPKSHTVPVRLLNVHNKPICVEAGIPVGELQDLNSLKVFEFSEKTGLSQGPNIFEKCFGENSLVSESQKNILKQLLEKNRDVFSSENEPLGKTNLVKHKIETGDHEPVKSKQFRLPFRQKEQLSQIVLDMQKDGIIVPSNSPWSANMFLVKKKDGSMRPVVDYRGLNSITKADVYPLPRIEDCLDSLAGAQFFSTLDLRSGYWQIAMDPQSQEKTAFTTPFGHFEFSVMPFGIKNAPSDFQRIMEIALSGLQWKSCIVYIDDILVFSRTFDQHLKDLENVFSALRKVNLKIKPTKCTFLRKEVPYLGHIVSREGIRPDPEKISAIVKAEPPKTVKQLQSFLGCIQWFKRFVPNLAEKVYILYKLTAKGEKFSWNENHTKAFENVKNYFLNPPVLKFPIFDKESTFVLTTDASNYALGAILSQMRDGKDVGVIAYASRVLNKHEKNYATIEKEALAIVWATKNFRHYLYGAKFIVRSDHKPLKWLLNLKDPSSKLMRWTLKLQEYNCEIEYTPGKENGGADWLSRNLNVSPVILSDPENDFQKEAESDVFIQGIKNQLTSPDCPQGIKNEFEVFGNVLMRRYHPKRTNAMLWQVVIPNTWIKVVLHQMHDSEFSAHFGLARTTGRILQRYWWPTLTSDVNEWCKTCEICIKRKSPVAKIKAPLKSIPVEGPWDRVAVDCLEYPVSKRKNRYVVVFMDYLTKWAEAIPVPNIKATTISKLFINEIVCRFGAPRQLLSDKGSNFTSTLLQEVCDILNTQKIFTTPYHPQTDGLVERFNRTLSSALSTLVSREPACWDDYVQYVLFAYRASCQESTGFSPFMLSFGREPRYPIELQTTPTQRSVCSEESFLNVLRETLTEIREKAKLAIEKAQKHQKEQYDKNSTLVELQVGDKVYLQRSAFGVGVSPKLSLKWDGPFQIDEKFSEINVRISLIADSRVSKIVHVNRLKKVESSDSELRDIFREGDLVFAKVKGHPFWPAKICKFSDVPAKLSLRDYDNVPVQFFGKVCYGLCENQNIIPFSDTSINRFLLCKSKGFSVALQKALLEFKA